MQNIWCSLIKSNQLFYLEITHGTIDNIEKNQPSLFSLMWSKISFVILILGEDLISSCALLLFLSWVVFLKVIPQLKCIYKEGERKHCCLVKNLQRGDWRLCFGTRNRFHLFILSSLSITRENWVLTGLKWIMNIHQCIL